MTRKRRAVGIVFCGNKMMKIQSANPVHDEFYPLLTILTPLSFAFLSPLLFSPLCLVITPVSPPSSPLLLVTVQQQPRCANSVPQTHHLQHHPWNRRGAPVPALQLLQQGGEQCHRHIRCGGTSARAVQSCFHHYFDACTLKSYSCCHYHAFAIMSYFQYID